MDHKSFYKASPSYAAVYDRFGALLSEDQAERLAESHCTTLEALEDEGLVREGTRVSTLSIFEVLGY